MVNTMGLAYVALPRHVVSDTERTPDAGNAHGCYVQGEPTRCSGVFSGKPQIDQCPKQELSSRVRPRRRSFVRGTRCLRCSTHTTMPWHTERRAAKTLRGVVTICVIRRISSSFVTCAWSRRGTSRLPRTRNHRTDHPCRSVSPCERPRMSNKRANNKITTTPVAAPTILQDTLVY